MAPFFNNPILIIAVLLFSISLHEAAHGWVADRLGDPTARIAGRLTLNPLAHLDPLMSILLPLLFIITGSPIIFGSAKPVPVDPFNFREPKKDMGLVGLAGPAAFFLLALLGAALLRILPFLVFLPTILVALLTALSFNLIQINLYLFFFNLIPIPPFDGSRVLASVLPNEQAQSLMRLESYGLFIILFLFFFPLPFFSLPGIISHLASFFIRLLM